MGFQALKAKNPYPMTYTSLVVKLVASAIVVTSIVIPQSVNSTESVIEYPTPVAATTSVPAVVAVKKPVVHVTTTKGDCTKYTALFEQYDWATSTAMQICKDESQGNPEAVNWNDVHRDAKGNVICISSQGLMQVSCAWPPSLGYKMDDLQDPAKNIAMAYLIYSKQGFSPWTTYKQ